MKRVRYPAAIQGSQGTFNLCCKDNRLSPHVSRRGNSWGVVAKDWCWAIRWAALNP